jgi:hypothetical protein
MNNGFYYEDEMPFVGENKFQGELGEYFYNELDDALNNVPLDNVPLDNVPLGDVQIDFNNPIGLFDEEPVPAAIPPVAPVPVVIPPVAPVPAVIPPLPAVIPPVAPVPARRAPVAQEITPKFLYNLYKAIVSNRNVDLNVLAAEQPCSSQLRERCKRNYYNDNRHRPNFNNIKCISKKCLLQICKELNINPYSSNRYMVASKDDLISNAIQSQITANPHIWCLIHKHKDNTINLIQTGIEANILNDRIIITTCNILYNRPPQREDIPFITKLTKNIIKLSHYTITEVAKYMIAVNFPLNTNVYTFAHRLTTHVISAAIISDQTTHDKIPRSKSRIVTILNLNPPKITLLSTNKNTIYILHPPADNTFETNPLFLQTIRHFTPARNLDIFTNIYIEVPIGLNHIYTTLMYYFIKTGTIQQDIIDTITESLQSANPHHNTRELLTLSNFLINTYMTN